MAIVVSDHEDIFSIGSFHITLDILNENGRVRFGCQVYEQHAEEEYVRRSIATKIYKTKEEAISQAWVEFLKICDRDLFDRTKSFAAYKKCGCMIAATVWNGRNDTVDVVKKWHQEGDLINLVATEQVREEFVGWDCPHEVPLLKMMEASSNGKQNG